MGVGREMAGVGGLNMRGEQRNWKKCQKVSECVRRRSACVDGDQSEESDSKPRSNYFLRLQQRHHIPSNSLRGTTASPALLRLLQPLPTGALATPPDPHIPFPTETSLKFVLFEGTQSDSKSARVHTFLQRQLSSELAAAISRVGTRVEVLGW